MCVVLVYFLTVRPFLKNLYWTIYWWLCKQNITWLRRSMRKRCNRIPSEITILRDISQLHCCCWLIHRGRLVWNLCVSIKRYFLTLSVICAVEIHKQWIQRVLAAHLSFLNLKTLFNWIYIETLGKDTNFNKEYFHMYLVLFIFWYDSKLETCGYLIKLIGT